MSSSYPGNPTHYGENTYPSQTDSFQDLMDSDSLDPLGLQQPAPFTASAPRPSVLFSVPQYPSELQPPVVPTMSSGRNDSAQNANKYQTRNIQPEDQLFENSRINSDMDTALDGYANSVASFAPRGAGSMGNTTGIFFGGPPLEHPDLSAGAGDPSSINHRNYRPAVISSPRQNTYHTQFGSFQMPMHLPSLPDPPQPPSSSSGSHHHSSSLSGGSLRNNVAYATSLSSHLSTHASSSASESQSSQPAKRRRRTGEQATSSRHGHTQASTMRSQPPVAFTMGNQPLVTLTMGPQPPSSTLTLPYIPLTKEEELYLLVIKYFFPEFTPEELFPLEVDRPQARAKATSLRGNDKDRVFTVLEDHKNLLKHLVTFSPVPKGQQLYDNNNLKDRMLGLYEHAFGQLRTRAGVMEYIKFPLFEASLVLLFFEVRKGYTRSLSDMFFAHLDYLPPFTFAYNTVMVNNCSESYDDGIKVSCKLDESAHHQETNIVLSVLNSMVNDPEFMQHSRKLMRIHRRQSVPRVPIQHTRRI